MWTLIRDRPPRPDLPQKLIQELELRSLNELHSLRNMLPCHSRRAHGTGDIDLSRDPLDAWIAWKHADAEWREMRLYRATTAGVIIAFLGLIVALIAAVEG
jgi:hypothetical protein